MCVPMNLCAPISVLERLRCQIEASGPIPAQVQRSPSLRTIAIVNVVFCRSRPKHFIFMLFSTVVLKEVNL